MTRPAYHRSPWSRPFRALVAAAVLAVAPPAPAGAAPEGLLRPAEGRLENGLRVFTLEDPSAAVLTVQVWYGVGSRNERPGITGISHLFEHLMFKGSENVGAEEHARRIQAVGGVSNAYTAWDVTVYLQDVPPDQLDLVARLEADRMRSLQLTEENLGSERDVVKEERRLSVESQPIARAVEELHALAFERHPYRWPIIGTMADIDSITVADLRRYYRIHYAPDKATLIVCGPVKHKDVMKTIAKHFEDLRPGEPAPPVETVEPEQTVERRGEVRTEAQLPVLIAGYKSPPEAHPDTPALEMASRILSEGQSSRLHRKLVYEDQSALFAGGATIGRRDPGLFFAFAAVKPGRDRSAVEATLFAEIERLGREGPTEEELAKARRQAESDFVFQLETVQGRARALGEAALIAGDPTLAHRRLEQVRAVRAGDVQRVIRTYLVPERRTVVWLIPEPGERRGS